jgi:DNA-binding NarL/FixJ family response regulator
MIKVLIADDQPILTGTIEYYFDRSRKYELVTAHSSNEAARIAADNPDTRIVVLDTDCLGKGSIIEVVKGFCPECKFLLWSGLIVGDENPADYRVDAVLPKAAHPAELLRKLADLCPQEVVAA